MITKRFLSSTTTAALVVLIPVVTARSQTTRNAVLRGALTLLPAPPAGSVGANSPSYDGSPAPVQALVDAARGNVVIWAPDAQRVELQLDAEQGSTTRTQFATASVSAPRTWECQRLADDPRAPVSCAAAKGLLAQPNARVTVAVYYGLNGSR